MGCHLFNGINLANMFNFKKQISVLMPTSMAFDRCKSSSPANFPQVCSPFSHASGWKPRTDFTDEVNSWMRYSGSLKKSKYSYSSRLSSPVSGSFFPICAKRSIRTVFQYPRLQAQLKMISFIFMVNEWRFIPESKAKAPSWRQNWQP